jgi:uncharacterized alkaline shock family protein YloU
MFRKEESRTELGTVRIHKNVVASIASLAATEGVKRIGGDFKSGILGLIDKKAIFAIKVGFDKNEEVKLDIPLVIQYGYNIPDIANSVQESVRNALEKMTSLSIKDININVQGIERG